MSQSKQKKEIKWHSNWLSLTDKCGGVIRDWCQQDPSKYAFYPYCGSNFSFSTHGSHDLKQHSKTQTQNKNRKVQSSSSRKYFKPQQLVIDAQSLIADCKTNTEILWMLEVASADYSLRSCDSITKSFYSMFNCDVTRNMISVLVTT